MNSVLSLMSRLTLRKPIKNNRKIFFLYIFYLSKVGKHQKCFSKTKVLFFGVLTLGFFGFFLGRGIIPLGG